MNYKPLVSIITVCFNSEKTIEDTIKSVISQKYDNIEYIIVDGKSEDSTMQIIDKYRNETHIYFKVISETDKGLYDAMNKGISMATGDVVGILNSDDMLIDDNVIYDIVNKFQDEKVELVYGDLVFVDEENVNKIVRRWVSKRGKFRLGWMPPHPTVYVRKHLYDKVGNFDISYRIAADYDILYKFLVKAQANCEYVKRSLIKMRVGGESTQGIKSTITLNKESYNVLKKYNVRFSSFTIFMKIARKIPQVIFK